MDLDPKALEAACRAYEDAWKPEWQSEDYGEMRAAIAAYLQHAPPVADAETVERVARAIAGQSSLVKEHGIENVNINWECFRDYARAAITALAPAPAPEGE